MAIGFNPKKERVHVLKCDKDLPSEEQTRFFYRILPYGDFTEARDGLVEWHDAEGDKPGHTRVKQGSNQRTVIMKGLIRWENLKDEDGNELVYPERNDTKAKDEALSALQPEWREELFNVILRGSKVEEKAKGESASPSA